MLSSPRSARSGLEQGGDRSHHPRPGPWDPSMASALTGHVFNMLHDNSKPCVGLNGPGGTSHHVMAPVMAHVDPEEPWSPCSARFITDFLDNGYGEQAHPAWHSPPPGQGC